MSFPCTKCGQCCKNIGKIKQLSEFHLGNGICIYFNENVGCTIYQSRPDVCRIDEGYTKFFSSLMTLDEFYEKNAAVCNKLQEDKDMDIIFKVII
ncbi:YkgJ family cysteine cluster protein [Iodobacter sp.]|uniref:YkgJ family cysteine cluster protein n=1 Tax=Iodobacter sp. TaxID=1915058 RepID=UPI0035B595EF